MIYWKGGEFWLGRPAEHPEVMTQEETLRQLEEKIKRAYGIVQTEDLPDKHGVEEIAISSEFVCQLLAQGCVPLRAGAKRNIYMKPPTGQRQLVPAHKGVDNVVKRALNHELVPSSFSSAVHDQEDRKGPNAAPGVR